MAIPNDKEETEELRALTEQEAMAMIIASTDYLTKITDHTNGRHRTEVVAEAMERDAKFDLASDAMAIHTTVKAFGNGDFKKIAYFAEAPVLENFVAAAEGTKFEKAANTIAHELEPLEEVLYDKLIDWEKSSEVLARVKREKFPETLSMVEKLTNHQRGHLSGRE